MALYSSILKSYPSELLSDEAKTELLKSIDISKIERKTIIVTKSDKLIELLSDKTGENFNGKVEDVYLEDGKVHFVLNKQ